MKLIVAMRFPDMLSVRTKLKALVFVESGPNSTVGIFRSSASRTLSPISLVPSVNPHVSMLPVTVQVQVTSAERQKLSQDKSTWPYVTPAHKMKQLYEKVERDNSSVG